MRRRIIISTVLLLYSALSLSAQEQTPVAQAQISPTPVRAVLVTSTPLPTDLALTTITVTATPTPDGPVLLEAKTTAGEVNVRAAPDIEAQRIGSISTGQTYVVLGRYFRWIQLQYDEVQKAWVFDELVDIIGDSTKIAEVNPFTEPTADTSGLEATQTWEAVALTPGGVLTATAEAPVLIIPTRDSAVNPILENSGALPTFTLPPFFATQVQSFGILSIPTATPAPEVFRLQSDGSLPPILPIALLGGIGLIGVLLSSLRKK